jgi:hypothetical protein
MFHRSIHANILFRTRSFKLNGRPIIWRSRHHGKKDAGVGLGPRQASSCHLAGGLGGIARNTGRGNYYKVSLESH